jgi:transcriptional regulator with XRE-family HTH domain
MKESGTGLSVSDAATGTLELGRLRADRTVLRPLAGWVGAGGLRNVHGSVHYLLYRAADSVLRPREPLNLPVTTIQEPTPARSPVADVRAQPGQITVLPRNWPLIQARLASGMTPRDVAIAVGIRQTDYARIEDGQQLPTDDQAAKICTLLRLRVEETFVVAAPEPLTGKGPIRGLSLLGIMRAKRRLSMKDMALQASQATGVSVGAGLIGQIERGALKQPLRPDQESQLKALAEYLAVPVEIVMAQVPPEWIQVSTAQIATLHSAMREAHAALPAPPTGELQLTAGVVET